MTCPAATVYGMAAKEFRPKAKATPPKRVDFTLIGIRDGVEEPHEFTAKPRLDWGPLVGVVVHQEKNTSIKFLDQIIRRSLANDDGTPALWEPNIVDGHFTAPNGDHTPVDRLHEFQTYDVGSSRRRWMHLFDEDDDIEIELEQIMEIFEWLAEEAAERPTQKSSASPT